MWIMTQFKTTQLYKHHFCVCMYLCVRLCVCAPPRFMTKLLSLILSNSMKETETTMGKLSVYLFVLLHMNRPERSFKIHWQAFCHVYIFLCSYYLSICK